MTRAVGGSLRGTWLAPGRDQAYADFLQPMAPDDAALDIDLLAASLRIDTSDLGAFVEALAVKLENVLPGRVRVERRREGLFGPKLVHRIALDAGDRRLELLTAGGSIDTRCSRLSGGIDTDAWLAALVQALAVQARRSDSTRRALERLLIGDAEPGEAER
jgi:hypothetical protein